MASLILGGIGGALFGPIGFLAGSLLGSLIDPPKQQGPRLSDLKLQGSSYGSMIPIPWGMIRVAGQVIWQTDLTEHSHTSGGKGGPKTTTYTYTSSFDVEFATTRSFGEDAIADVPRVWADSRLVYDKTGGSSVGTGGLPFTLYVGNETDLPDPTEEAVLGVGNVPAYRGVARAVFADLVLTDYGNRLPNLTFEIVTKGPTESAIRIIKRMWDSPTHFAYKTAFTVPGAGWPAITQWNMNGVTGEDDIHVTTPTVGTFYTPPTSTVGYSYDFDLAYNGPIAADPWPSPTYLGIGAKWYPLGVYVYADATTIFLFKSLYVTTENLIGASSTQYAAVGAGAVFIDDPTGAEIPTGANFCKAAGVPTGEYFKSSALTQDGTAFFVFTAPTALGTANKWYRIVDGIVDLTGTCGAGVPGGLFMGWGQASMEETRSAMFENNRTYCWAYVTNGSTTAVTVYKITGTVFDVDPIAGHFPQVPVVAVANSLFGVGDGVNPDPSKLGGGTVESACYVPAEGYCGIVAGTMMTLLTRFAEGGGQAVPLSEIVGDVSTMAGLPTAQVDVTDLTPLVDGYVLTQQATCANSIAPLRQAYFFDGAEQDTEMRFLLRGRAPVATIPASDLGAFQFGAQPGPLMLTVRQQEVELPRVVTVTYLNIDADYQNASQISQRLVTYSQLATAMELPIVMDSLKGKSVADINLFEAWMQRDALTIKVPRKYAYLEPMDVVTANGRTMRIIDKSETVGNVIELKGLATIASIYTQAAVSGSSGGQDNPPVAPPSQSAQLVLMDIPLLTDGDSPNGFYAAMAGKTGTGWPGGAVYESSDGGTTYHEIASTGAANTIGLTTSALGNFSGGNVFDEVNTVNVVIGLGGGTLSSADELSVLNGANEGLIGNEIVQWKNVDMTSASNYTLSGFLRGRRGTEWAIPYHSVSETFVAFNPEVLNPVGPFGELAQVEKFKGITFGQTLTAVTAQDFSNTGNALKPYSPTALGGGLDASNNHVLTWARRTRIGGAWLDYVDVLLAEATEAYVVQIWDSTYSICARVITGITSPTTTYSAADEVTDFGAAQQDIFWTVGQVGSFTLGAQSQGTAQGVGGSNNAPLNPVTPYGGGPPSVISLTMVWPASGSDTINTTSGFKAGGTYVIKTTATTSLGAQFLWSPAAGSLAGSYKFVLSNDAAGTSPIASPLYGLSSGLAWGAVSGNDYYFIITAQNADGSLSAPAGANADFTADIRAT